MNNPSVQHPNHFDLDAWLEAIRTDTVLPHYVDDYFNRTRPASEPGTLPPQPKYYDMNEVFRTSEKFTSMQQLWLHWMEQYLLRNAVTKRQLGDAVIYQVLPGLSDIFAKHEATLRISDDGAVIFEIIGGRTRIGFYKDPGIGMRFTFSGNTWPKPEHDPTGREDFRLIENTLQPSSSYIQTANALHLFLSPLLTNLDEGRVLRMSGFAPPVDTDSHPVTWNRPSVVAYQLASKFEMDFTSGGMTPFDFTRKHVVFAGYNTDELYIDYYCDEYAQSVPSVRARYKTTEYATLIQDLHQFFVTGSAPLDRCQATML